MSRSPAWSWSEDKDWIPLFDGEKQQKPLFPASRRPNETSQVVDSISV
jgi:hypothetical protein